MSDTQDVTRPVFAAAALASLTLLEACSSGSGGAGAAAQGNQTVASELPANYEAARFLQHAQFSSTEIEIAAVRAQGPAAWLDAQMALPSSMGGWDWLLQRGYGVVDKNQFYTQESQTNYMAWFQIMASPDGVRRRIALALSEYFVVGGGGIAGTTSWAQFAMAAYWDVLCKNAFGNFRSLIEDITLNLAMGAYLNTNGNLKEDPSTGRLPDENYAREVMQLFSIGLYQLNLDGTLKLDSKSQPIETYTQSDVSNLARVFTGYLPDYTDGFVKIVVPPYDTRANVAYSRRPMILDSTRHSSLRADFLGFTVTAGTDGATALKIALDALFNHSNVGPFFGRQMIQRLVCSNPSPDYVARVASAFNNNGKGVRGDLAAVFKAILLDSEATGPAGLTSVSFGKVREPIVRIAQWAHTFKVTSLKGNWKVGDTTTSINSRDSASAALNQSPLEALSVFNFFRPGFVPSAQSLSALGVTVPELQITNESTTASYINFLSWFLRDGMASMSPELITNTGIPSPTDGLDVVPDYTAELALVGNPSGLINHLNLILCAGQLSSETVSMMIAALSENKSNTASPDAWKRDYVAQALMFVMCCPEYLVQK